MRREGAGVMPTQPAAGARPSFSEERRRDLGGPRPELRDFLTGPVLPPRREEASVAAARREVAEAQEDAARPFAGELLELGGIASTPKLSRRAR